MENYIVSARKYRPDTFETVVSQKSLTTTLKNAIHSGKLAHAYLFCGPRGVGKTTCARIFAKTINCTNPTENGEPCNQCESCQSFNEQRSYSIYELDAASNNSVEDIRSLNEQVRIPPQVGKYKVYIIDEVHMLSQAAFNAFLKTLEEPPAHAIFILATTEKHKIIPTILSRCQIYDFSRIEVADIIAHLQNIATKEGINTEHEALRIIAQKSDGCMRDALSLFDQMASFTQGDLTYAKVISSLNVLDYEYYFRLTDFIIEGKTSQSLLLFNDVLNRGFEGNIFIEGAASHFRDLLVNSDDATAQLFEGSAELRNRYVEQAKRCTPKMLFGAIKLCSNCSLNYRTSRNKRLHVELTLIELTQMGDSDGDEGGGRSPKMLKPIFNKAQQNSTATVAAQQPTAQRAQVMQQTAPQTQQQPQAQHAQTAQQQPTAQHAQQTQQTAPQTQQQPQTQAAPVLQGRPAELRNSTGGGTSIGKMFQRSRAAAENSGSSTPPTQQTGPVAATAGQQTATAQQAQRVEITNAMLSQAWTSFALQLPENERALADRMKIMQPRLEGDNSFTLSVDNQMAADFFASEEKRICEGISKELKCPVLKMKITVNEVIIERHVSDKGKQFAMLVEKNPLIEKLRKELNLELAR
ncbi:MAG: DNA polymerase III subunit gamma/tau [Bacteroidaceae bacterium]|nr:DNA polymerase III subunit gamma/tau [Bacteroidaceae bacterium]